MPRDDDDSSSPGDLTDAMNSNFWNEPLRQLMGRLETSPAGLSGAEAARRRARYGPNSPVVAVRPGGLAAIRAADRQSAHPDPAPRERAFGDRRRRHQLHHRRRDRPPQRHSRFRPGASCRAHHGSAGAIGCGDGRCASRRRPEEPAGQRAGSRRHRQPRCRRPRPRRLPADRGARSQPGRGALTGKSFPVEKHAHDLAAAGRARRAAPTMRSSSPPRSSPEAPGRWSP